MPMPKVSGNWRRWVVLGPTAACAHTKTRIFCRLDGRMPWHRVELRIP